MEFLAEYGIFLAKTVTFLVALVAVIAILTAVGSRARRGEKGHLELRLLNEQIETNRDVLKEAFMDHSEVKADRKAKHKSEKKKRKRVKKGAEPKKKRIFVINFNGDMKASAVSNLREEITAILGVAEKDDEVVVCLESPGGMVHSYGLASSQLDRVRKQGIPLTVCVDKVAASGGYMMACVADKILAAPFAYIGSIGVLAQLPNFHRLLKKHDVDFEILTAGEYKRTLSMLGENTDKGREKFIRDLEDTHGQFKAFVSGHREKLDIDEVATGEVWLGDRAHQVGLVDEVMTSDEYLTSQLDEADIVEVSYVAKKSLQERVGIAAEERMDSLLLRWWQRLTSKTNIS